MRGFVKQAVVVFFINIVYLSTYSLVSNDLSAAPKPSKSQTIFSQRNMVFIKVRANSMEEVEKLNAMGIDYKSVGARTVPVEQSRLEEFAEMGINFEIARVLNRGKIEARVWERGVGETLACGSGASAIAVAAQLLDYVNYEVEIILRGGALTVCWDRLGEVSLSGPVVEVFAGEWPEEGS